VSPLYKKASIIHEKGWFFCRAGTPIPAAIPYKILLNRSERASCKHRERLIIVNAGRPPACIFLYQEKMVVEAEADFDFKNNAKAMEHGFILAVDDNPTLLRMLKKLLHKLGRESLTAASGPEAIEIFKTHRGNISLVILDIIMPGMPGADVFHELKRINPEVRIVLCSGYSMDGVAGSLIEKGAAGFLQKPFLLEELKRTLEEAGVLSQ
jgi:CheY-like chemotaxis protein